MAATIDDTKVQWDEAPAIDESAVAWDDAAPQEAPPASTLDTITALPRGAYHGVVRGLPEMAGKATEFAGSYLPAGISEPVQAAGKALSETSLVQGRLTPAELEQEQTAAQSRTGAEKMLFSAGEMLGPSLIPGGAFTGAARGALGVAKIGKLARAAAKAGDVAETVALGAKATARAKKALNIGAGAAAGLFGGAQAQNTRDTAMARAGQLEAEGDVVGAEKMRDRAFGVAPFVTGGIEAAGEFFGTKYLGKLLGVDVAEKLIERGIKPGVIKSFLRTVGVEVGTELGQQGGQAAVEKYSDIRPDANILEEMKSVIGPTVILTALTGIGGNAAQSIAQRGGNAKIRNVLLTDAQTLGIPDAQTLPNDQLEEQVWRGYAEKYDIPDRDTATVADLRKLVPEFAVTRAREAIEAKKVRVSAGLEALDLTRAPAAAAGGLDLAPAADQAAISQGFDSGVAAPASARPAKTKADEGLWSVPEVTPEVTPVDPAVLEGRRPLDLAGVSRAPVAAQQPNQPPATAPVAAAPVGRANGEVLSTPQADLLGAEDSAQQLGTLTPGAVAPVQGDEDGQRGTEVYPAVPRLLGERGRSEAPSAQGGAQVSRDAAEVKIKGVASRYFGLDEGTVSVVEPVKSPTSEVIAAVSKVTGRRVYFVRGLEGRTDGVAVDGDVYLSEETGRPLLVAFGHELSHTGTPEAEAQYLSALMGAVDKKKYAAFVAQQRKLYRSHGQKPLSPARTLQEFGADFLGEQMTTTEFWERLKQNDRSVYRKIVTRVLEMLKAIGIKTQPMAHYFGGNGSANMAKAVKAAQTYFESLAAPATQGAAAGPEFALATDEQLVRDLQAQEQTLAPGARRQMVMQQRVEAEARVRNAKRLGGARNEFGGDEARFALTPEQQELSLDGREIAAYLRPDGAVVVGADHSGMPSHKDSQYSATRRGVFLTRDATLKDRIRGLPDGQGEIVAPPGLGQFVSVEEAQKTKGDYFAAAERVAQPEDRRSATTDRRALIDEIIAYHVRPVTELREMSDEKLTELRDYLVKREQDGTLTRGAGPVSQARFALTPKQREAKLKDIRAKLDALTQTKDPRKAGFILPDGRMMIKRGDEHRMTFGDGAEGSIEDLYMALQDGAVRVDYQFGVVDIASAPNPEVIAGIREFVGAQKYGAQVGLEEGDRKDYLRYPPGTAAETVIRDIKVFYGQAPKLAYKSPLAEFRGGQDDAMFALPQGEAADEGLGLKLSQPTRFENSVQRKYQNKDLDIEVLVNEMQEFIGKELPEDRNPWLRSQLYRARTSEAIKHFNDKQVNPLIAKLQNHHITTEQMDEFLIMRRAADYNAHVAMINPDMPAKLDTGRDAGSGFSQKMIDEYFKALTPVKRKVYDKLAAEVDAWRTDMQEILVKSGLETRDTINIWNSTDPNYVPFHREKYAKEMHNATGKGTNVRGEFSRRVLGSNEKIFSPLAGMGLAMHRAITLAEKNRVSQSAWALAVENPNEDIYTPIDFNKNDSVDVKQAWAAIEAAEVKFNQVWGAAYYQKIKELRDGGSRKPTILTALQDLGLSQDSAANVYADARKILALETKYTRLRKAQATSAPKIIAALRSLGLSHEDAVNVYAEPQVRRVNPRTGMVEVTRNPFIQNAENVLNLRINGEDKILMFNTENERGMQVLKALKNEDVGSIDGFLSTAAKATRWIAKANTQWNPLFGFRNFMRDFSTAMLNLSSTPLAGKQTQVAKYATSALRHLWIDARAERDGKPLPDSQLKGLLTEAREDGVPTAYRDMFDNAKQYQESLIAAFKYDANQGAAVRARNIGKAFAGVLEDYNAVTEMAFRFATYRAAREANVGGDGANGPNTRAKAALLAKDITVNFDRKGQNSSQMGALYAFFNASMQGTARLKRTMIGANGLPSKTGMQTAAGGILLGVLQGAMLRAMGVGDDDEPRQYEREKNLLIPNPFKAGDWIKIPMPLGFNVLPNIGRIAFETSMSGEPTKRLIDLLGSVADTFNPLGSENNPVQIVSPTVMDPFTNLLANQDWNGRPIYRENFDRLHPESGPNRSREDATALSQLLVTGLDWATGGRENVPGKLSFTADAVDYLAGYVGGGAARETIKATQYLYNKATGGEGLPAYKTPGIGGFHTDTTDLRGAASTYFANTERVYEAMTALDYRKANRLGTSGFYEKYPEGRLIGVLKDTKRQLREFKQTHDVLMLRKTRVEKGSAPDRAQQLEVVKERLKRVETRKLEAMQRFNVRVKAAAQKAREAKDRSMVVGR